MNKTCITLLSLAATLATPLTARAAWLGLTDGSYAVTLNCTVSSKIDCSQAISGTITVSGGGLSAMNFDVDAQNFAGDADDFVFHSAQFDSESSSITHTPNAFLSLRMITSGSFGNFDAGDRWWAYCHNVSPNSCSAGTEGVWTATPLATVDEPPVLATLGLAGLVGLGLRRRGQVARRGDTLEAAARPVV